MPVGQISGTFLVQYFAPDLLRALLVPGAIGLAGVLVLAVSLRGREEEAGEVIVGTEGVSASEGVAAAEAIRAGEATSAPGAIADEGATSPAKAIAAAASEPRPAHGPGRRRDFAWAWASRVHFVVGSVFIQAYQPFLLLDVLKFDAADVPRLIFRSTLVQAAMMVLWSVIAGRLSDRLRRRKPIAMVGTTLQGMGLWLIAVAPSYTLLLLGIAVAGIGHGIYEGVDLALVTEVLPDRDRHAAKDLGLLNVANALPQVVAPLAAPVILDATHGNYMLLFLMAGAVPVIGAALLVPLKGAR